MKKFSRTWWGEKFIEALEKFTEEGRLSRGRSYASRDRVLSFELSKGKITARVRGNINPYFGVYKEPKYNITIEIKEIPRPSWVRVIKLISSKASFISRLLMNEMPDNIEEVFDEYCLHLLPRSNKDFKTHCSCPDSANPCKHIAGVYYLVAGEFDRDPFLMFKLRGLEQEELKKELAKTPLGEVLIAGLHKEEVDLKSSDSYYTKVDKEEVPEGIPLRDFWSGKKIPQSDETLSETAIPAILIKKQGDYPPFWDKDFSFIETMEEFYLRVRSKNKKIL
jgi:uncharacterized Zn finger protein